VVDVEAFFGGLPLVVNALIALGALYVVVRASHYLVDGAIHMAHEFRISPLVIGATVVAMGTSSAELAVNLTVVLGKGDTSAVVGNILGSNLVNIGIELGVAVLIAGVITLSRGVLEKDLPLYLAATGLLSALIFDGQIGRLEAAFMLLLFVAAVGLIVQYARAKDRASVLLVEATEIEAISHPTALHLSRGQALLSAIGGLVVLVMASRLLVVNTAAVATALHIPQFVIGLVIIGPGTSLPEIASSIQAARRGHADLVVGTVFGSNLFNLLFGLGLPALIFPLSIEKPAILGFVFLNAVNLVLLLLLTLDSGCLGRAGAMKRPVGFLLILAYVGFISYQVVDALGGTPVLWLGIIGVLLLTIFVGWGGWEWAARVRSRAHLPESRPRILCATRGGSASQLTHERAIALAKERGAELIFLYVFDRDTLQRVATPIVINVETQIERMLAFLQATAQEQARLAGVPARVAVCTGNLIGRIEAVSKEEEVELIVMGSPAGAGGRFARKAIQELAADIEAATGITVLALGADEGQNGLAENPEGQD
jgi:cation:H+ antiporter